MPKQTPEQARSLAERAKQATYRHQALMFTAVFVGGAAGSLLREVFAVNLPGLPYLTSTFGINVVACFVLGWLYSVRHRVHAHVLHLGAVGFCGGLSTFSSFVADLEVMAMSSGWMAATAAVSEIAVGLGAAILGEMTGRRFQSGGFRT